MDGDLLGAHAESGGTRLAGEATPRIYSTVTLFARLRG